jgi:hypothetical protein
MKPHLDNDESILSTLSNPQNIRLLHVDPGFISEPIKCSQEEVYFDSQQPEYEALSYT